MPETRLKIITRQKSPAADTRGKIFRAEWRKKLSLQP
jgi:hypothetical protein